LEQRARKEIFPAPNLNCESASSGKNFDTAADA
jgi:hypothetical protein